MTDVAEGTRAVLTALVGAADTPAQDLEELRADAAIGRALREAAHAPWPVEPLIHISWCTDRGGTTGRFLGDPRLAWHREQLAAAAHDLLDHLAGDEGEGARP